MVRVVVSVVLRIINLTVSYTVVLVVKNDSVIKFTSQIVLNFIWSELFVSVLYLTVTFLSL